MEWLKKIRNGAYFIDLLLVIAAIFCIIGLATYVRLNGQKKTVQPPVQTKLAVTGQHLSPLDKTTTDNASKKQDNSTQNAHTNETCNDQCKQHNEPNKVKSCDESMKQQIMSSYMAKITAENNTYASELKSKQNSGQTSEYTDLNRLSEEHQKTLIDLETSVNVDIAKIYCTL